MPHGWALHSSNTLNGQGRSRLPSLSRLAKCSRRHCSSRKQGLVGRRLSDGIHQRPPGGEYLFKDAPGPYRDTTASAHGLSSVAVASRERKLPHWVAGRHNAYFGNFSVGPDAHNYAFEGSQFRFGRGLDSFHDKAHKG